MSGFPGRDATRNDLAEEIARLRSLADDLEQLAAGNIPDPVLLDSAPFIERYALSTRKVPCLIGQVSGHPILRGPAIVNIRALADLAAASLGEDLLAFLSPRATGGTSQRTLLIVGSALRVLSRSAIAAPCNHFQALNYDVEKSKETKTVRAERQQGAGGGKPERRR
jgi:hypothetical protein